MIRTIATLVFLISASATGFAAHAETAQPKWFTSLDADRSGAITLSEMHHARWSRFARLDADRDGFLDRDEIAASAQWVKHFRWYDENNDERISVTEFEAKGRERFVAMDSDGDGRVTLDEIQTLQRAQNSPAAKRSAG